MSNNIDELSQIIGQLQASMSTVARNTEIINAKLDSTNTLVIQTSMKADAAHARQDKIDAEIKELNTAVDDNTAFKNKQMGVVAFISLLCTVVGSGILKVVGVLFHP
jgi:uncharacterized coiled-coil DUF342 family protein